MSVTRLYFENKDTILRLHIFTDASEELICFLTYLQDRTRLELTYKIGKCCVAPIKYMKLPKFGLAADGTGLRVQILIEHYVKFDKTCYWTDPSTVLYWLPTAHKKQIFLLQTEQR